MGEPSIPRGFDVTLGLGDEQVTQHCKVLDTDAFDIVIGTDFLRCSPQVKLLSLKCPYALHCHVGSGLLCPSGAVRMNEIWSALREPVLSN